MLQETQTSWGFQSFRGEFDVTACWTGEKKHTLPHVMICICVCLFTGLQKDFAKEAEFKIRISIVSPVAAVSSQHYFPLFSPLAQSLFLFSIKSNGTDVWSAEVNHSRWLLIAATETENSLFSVWGNETPVCFIPDWKILVRLLKKKKFETHAQTSCHV